MRRIAKLFMNGRSQAVRLPSDFRFQGNEVYIRQDPATGDVILSKKPGNWEDFFRLADAASVPDDFMEERESVPNFEQQMSLAKQIMQEDRAILDALDK